MPPGVDATRPSPARLYDYILGGTNNFAVDRAAAERIRAEFPDTVDAVYANRGFHQRAARWMAEAGIRQFIDIGAGLPTVNNTHQAVQAVVPDARVVYVDNDPEVLAHATELLAGSAGTVLIEGDLRDPGRLLGHRLLREMIDFSQPVGLLMTGILYFVDDGSDPRGLIRQYVAALASGSYLAMSQVTADRMPPRAVEAITENYQSATERIHFRSLAEVERFFEGLELVAPYPGAEPAVTYAGLWGAEDPEMADTDGSRILYCGVGRKP